MSRLLEYDCILPRGEEFEVGAVGFCRRREKIRERDQLHTHIHALLQYALPICIHAPSPFRHYSYLYPCVER